MPEAQALHAAGVQGRPLDPTSVPLLIQDVADIHKKLDFLL